MSEHLTLGYDAQGFACRIERDGAALRARVAELERVGLAFLVKYDELEPAIVGAFQFMHIHGSRYNGPTYEQELADLRSALAAPDPKPGEIPLDRLRWAWETAADPDAPDREHAILMLESAVGLRYGWRGGDRDAQEPKP